MRSATRQSKSSHRITHIWHYQLSIRALHISERHLGALVLVEVQLRVIDVFNLVQWYLQFVSRRLEMLSRRHTSVLGYNSGDSDSSVSGHLHRPQTASLVSLFSQLLGPVCDAAVRKDIAMSTLIQYLLVGHRLFSISMLSSYSVNGTYPIFHRTGRYQSCPHLLARVLWQQPGPEDRHGPSCRHIWSPRSQFVP